MPGDGFGTETLVREARLTVPNEEIPRSAAEGSCSGRTLSAGTGTHRANAALPRKGARQKQVVTGGLTGGPETCGLGETSQKFPRGPTWGGATACRLPAGCSEPVGTALGTPRAGPGFPASLAWDCLHSYSGRGLIPL